MTRLMKALGGVALLVALTGLTESPLHAQNAITSLKVALEPTFQCMGVELKYSGDSNFNATGAVRYRAAGETKWRTGHPLVRISDAPMQLNGKGAKNPRFMTSLFYLKEGTEYEVQVELQDADGVTVQPAITRARTASSNFPLGGGRDYYVNAGATAKGDGSLERPFKTIADAAALGGPGDTLHFARGTYYVHGSMEYSRSGSESAWLRWLAEPGAVITDANPELSGVGKVKWEKYKQDPAGSWIYKAPITQAHRVMIRKTAGDPSTGYFLWRFMKHDGTKYSDNNTKGWGRGRSLQHMAEDYPRLNLNGAFIQERDALYMVLPRGMDDPSKVDIQISQSKPRTDAAGDIVGEENRFSGNRLNFKSHHLLIEGFTIELTAALLAGEESHQMAYRRLNHYGNNGRLHFAAGARGLIEDCRFIFTAGYDWGHSPPSKTDLGNRWDPWGKTKNGLNDNFLIGPGQAQTVRFNHFEGHNNTVHRSDNKTNVDIHNNVFMHAFDDAVEPDGPTINWRVFENYFADNFMCISAAPVSVGPLFAVRNVFDDFHASAIKFRNDCSGPQLYYHNTAYAGFDEDTYAHGPAPAEWPVKPTNRGMAFRPDGKTLWVKTRNNILAAGDGIYRFDAHNTVSFDHNCLMPLDGKKAFKLGEKSSITHQAAFANLKMTPTRLRDFRIADPKDATIDAGEIIKGINDEVPAPYQYKGKAPDIGAYEFGAERPHYGPRPVGQSQ